MKAESICGNRRYLRTRAEKQDAIRLRIVDPVVQRIESRPVLQLLRRPRRRVLVMQGGETGGVATSYFEEGGQEAAALQGAGVVRRKFPDIAGQPKPPP